ncbi:MAG: hypothetical protein HZC29_09415 [Thaumarchaeota archaeon]|nr:hypothetical protein [Nitrososphaerota archaeon]
MLISSVTLTNFASAYEKENHYWLKMALALNCGFTLDEARLISIGDFSIDEDPDTQPVRSGSDKSNPKWKWHALPTENPDVDKDETSSGNQQIKQRQHKLYDRAMNEKNTPMKLFKFGQYLHYQEDKWSHWGYTTGMGHAVPNVVPGMTSPDETHASPDSYRYMVFDSMVNLGKLAKSLGKNTECVSDLVPLDTYHSAPEYGKDFPWFSPQEIKRAKDPLKFQQDVNQHLSDWGKTALINEVITESDNNGDKGVTESFITYIANKTGISKSDISEKYDYTHVDIDENGNTKKLPDNLIKSVAQKTVKNNPVKSTKPDTSKQIKSNTGKASKASDTKTKAKVSLSADQLKSLYVASKWYEFAAGGLVDIKSFELEHYSELADSTWTQYSKSKSPSDLEQAQKYQKLADSAKTQTATTPKIFSQLKQNSKTNEDNAIKAKVSPSTLKQAAQEPISKLQQKQKIDSEAKLSGAYQNAKSAVLKGDMLTNDALGNIVYDDNASRLVNSLKQGLGMETSAQQQTKQVKTHVIQKQGSYAAPDDICTNPKAKYTLFAYFQFTNDVEIGDNDDAYVKQGSIEVPTSAGYSIKVNEDNSVAIQFPVSNPGKYTVSFTPQGVSESVSVEIIIPDDCLPKQKSNPQTPSEQSESIRLSANKDIISGNHIVGKDPCPTPLGSTTLSPAQGGTWSVKSMPPWLDVSVQGNIAKFEFNCNINPVTQHLSDNLVLAFSHDGKTDTLTIPVDVNVLKP